MVKNKGFYELVIPSYLNPDSPSKRGRKREKKATQTINSGSLYFDPRDIKVAETDENYLVDTKDVTSQSGFRFTFKDIDKFYKQSGSKTPVYLVYLNGVDINGEEQKYVVKAIIQKNYH